MLLHTTTMTALPNPVSTPATAAVTSPEAKITVPAAAEQPANSAAEPTVTLPTVTLLAKKAATLAELVDDEASCFF